MDLQYGTKICKEYLKYYNYKVVKFDTKVVKFDTIRFCETKTTINHGRVFYKKGYY